MGAHTHSRCCLVVGEASADREARAKRFGYGHDVGLAVFKPLVSEQLSGSSHPALYFVENQQDAMLRAQLPQALQESAVKGPRAAFALDWLDDHCSSDWVGDRRLDRRVFHHIVLAE